MKVSFDNSFYKRLVKIKNKEVLEKVKHIVLLVETADELRHIPGIQKMEGF